METMEIIHRVKLKCKPNKQKTWWFKIVTAGERLLDTFHSPMQDVKHGT